MKPFAIAGVQMHLHHADNLEAMRHRLHLLMHLYPWVQMAVFSELLKIWTASVMASGSWLVPTAKPPDRCATGPGVRTRVRNRHRRCTRHG